MKYTVYVREVWVQPFEVEADSKEEALKRVVEGRGVPLDNRLTYSHSPEDLTTTDNVDRAE